MRKGKKTFKRLTARRLNYESIADKRGYRCPGSNKK